MKFAAAAFALTALLAAAPSAALAAPQTYTFTVPLSLDFTGTSAAPSGQPITGFQVLCRVTAGATELALGKQEFTTLKVTQTISLVAKPTAHWLENPQSKPTTWFCFIQYTVGGGTYVGDYNAIQGADIPKSSMFASGKL
jgi:hypothetical protein